MKTLQQYHDNEAKITKAFLTKRDAAKRDFWCRTPQATEFYSHWDKKWDAIQAYLNRQWKKISAQYPIVG